MPAPDNNKKQQSTLRATEWFPFFGLIQSELEQVQQRIEELLCTPDEQIQQCLEYLIESPGKMIRPALVLLSGACVGHIHSEHIDLAAMVELIHRASLLHDDVIDSAQMRRGKRTANALWGNTAAVLLGDFLLSRAFHVGTSIQINQVAGILSQTAQDLCCGELRQNFWKGQWDISQQQYYQVIEAKTAVLFKSSCGFGAIASNAPREKIEALSQFGLHLGIAFQITDDLLDIIGTQKEAGKTLGTDWIQGKLTLPVIHWIQQDEEKKQMRITQLQQGCGQHILIRKMTKSGSMDYAFAQVEDQISRAKQRLEAIQHNAPRQSLCKLADYIVGRLK